jgi:hypothetical protein
VSIALEHSDRFTSIRQHQRIEQDGWRVLHRPVCFHFLASAAGELAYPWSNKVHDCARLDQRTVKGKKGRMMETILDQDGDVSGDTGRGMS